MEPAKSASLLTLPNELLHQIAIHLPTFQSYDNYALTNRRLSTIARSSYTRSCFLAQLKTTTSTIFAHVVDDLLHWLQEYYSSRTFFREFHRLHARSINESGHFILRVRRTDGVSKINVGIDWLLRLLEIVPTYPRAAYESDSEPETEESDNPDSNNHIYTAHQLIVARQYTAAQAKVARARLVWELVRSWDESGQGASLRKELFEGTRERFVRVRVRVGYEYLPRVDEDLGPNERSLLMMRGEERSGKRRVRWIF
ncbi:hypothetical protein BJ508DRAFT_350222 [Ascobolus immersus RN42]|uniref:F-box domain-containing protein n=1 Tax=Ascobolus immersus RN42 TaxID=1160509 RepID=A0A3N4HUW4_ASCIM|nr:hypothetical protein BJ508DRAFT_350222 [Ascobolus immersus RN42]